MYRVEVKDKQGKRWFYASYGEIHDACKAVTDIHKHGTSQLTPDDILEVILVLYQGTASQD